MGWIDDAEYYQYGEQPGQLKRGGGVHESNRDERCREGSADNDNDDRPKGIMKKVLAAGLALTLLACASPALAASLYRGQTSQHYPISLRVANGKVKFSLTYKLHCQHGSPTFTTATWPMNLRGQGFSYTFSEDMLTNTISGVFKDGVVSGTLNIHGSLTEHVNYGYCGTGKVSFRAKRS